MVEFFGDKSKEKLPISYGIGSFWCAVQDSNL